MIFGLLTFLFLLVCVILVFLIMVQDDKGGGISGAIGGGISSTANSVLGSQNAENILTRGTKIFAAAFFIFAIIITLWVAKGANQEKASISELKEFTAGVSDVSAPAAQGNAIMPFAPQTSEPSSEAEAGDAQIQLLPTEETAE